MKGTSILGKRTVLKMFVLGLLGWSAPGQIQAGAATDTARVVKYGQNDIVSIKAKLRFSTLIILPENEEILDFTTGDKEFWIINGAHNLCYIHPAQAGIRSNLNLITASGHVYSFLLTEISSDPNADPDLKIFIEPKEESGIGTDAFAQGYVPARRRKPTSGRFKPSVTKPMPRFKRRRRTPNSKFRNSVPSIRPSSNSITSSTRRDAASRF